MLRKLLLFALALWTIHAGAETLEFIGYQVKAGDIRFFLSPDGKIERIIMPPGEIRKGDSGRIDEVGGAKIRRDDEGRIENVDGEKIRRDDKGQITDIGGAQIKRDDDGKIFSIDGARIRRDASGAVTGVDENNTLSVSPVFKVTVD